VKPTLSPQDKEIIKLLKRLGALKIEYPAELVAARRAAFSVQIEQHKVEGARRKGKKEYFSQKQVIELLEGLKPVKAEYPAALRSARRAAFIAQVEQYNNGQVPDTGSSQDPVIELLEQLKSTHTEYPPNLLSARREAFLAQIRQHNQDSVQEEAPSEARVIDLLEQLQAARAEYPRDLLSARRTTFLAQIKQRTNGHVHEKSASEDPVMETLGVLRSSHAEYPPELLTARRKAFVAQIEQHNRGVGFESEPLLSDNSSLVQLLGRLKSIKVEYPRRLWADRRVIFVSQIREGKISVLEALRAFVTNLFHAQTKHPSAPAFSLRRTSVILATLLVAAFVGSLAFGNRRPLTGVFGSSLPQQEASLSSPAVAATSTGETAKIICKPGLQPPLCLAQEADQSQDLTFPGNGSARPAVAKDTLPGYSAIHQAANANDGVYGPGASWISNTAYSWIKIDLGEARVINTITFGRDRLGNLNDGDPGQFSIAVALVDDIYADGNSHNDSLEYKQVYNSKEIGFDGIISGPETIEATFPAVRARFIKITFENAGTAVDEIEAFMLQPSGLASNRTQRPRDTLVPPSFTPVPTNTLIPSKTPTLVPTNTLVPTRTPTLVPTHTPRPTSTDVPTDTPLPTDTATPRPTHTPRPTNTDVPTHTPEPPTDTPEPPPTDTPEPPPTDTPQPQPTETSAPFAGTAELSLVATGTPHVAVP
jgi:hypothetical protein